MFWSFFILIILFSCLQEGRFWQGKWVHMWEGNLLLSVLTGTLLWFFLEVHFPGEMSMLLQQRFSFGNIHGIPTKWCPISNLNSTGFCCVSIYFTCKDDTGSLEWTYTHHLVMTGVCYLFSQSLLWFLMAIPLFTLEAAGRRVFGSCGWFLLLISTLLFRLKSWWCGSLEPPSPQHHAIGFSPGFYHEGKLDSELLTDIILSLVAADGKHMWTSGLSISENRPLQGRGDA